MSPIRPPKASTADLKEEMPRGADFLSQAAPENYVAGLGRGATGFTTRSDLGPARSGPTESEIQEVLAKRAAKIANGDKKDDEEEGEERFQDPDNEVGLFARSAYDAEDEEADKVWEAVDERMARRRKVQREAREKREKEEWDRANPKLSQQFADLKRGLAKMSDDDWNNIPEVGDLTGKNKRQRRENLSNRRFYAVPDSLIAANSNQGQYDSSISTDDPDGGAASVQTSFADIGRAKDKVLQLRLDQAAKTTTSGLETSKTVDAKGYMTSLEKATDFSGEAQIDDQRRVRTLLDNVLKTNPTHAPAWIAAARLEQTVGKYGAARAIISRGCENCPRSEDVWLEAINLQTDTNKKIVAAEALKMNDQSVKLWTRASELESDVRAKKKILRKGIDHVPESPDLWRAAIDLEADVADARLMLAKAAELNPYVIDFWLALSRIETPENAQKVLAKARSKAPGNELIYIAAGRLQERLGKVNALPAMLKKAFSNIKEFSDEPITYENWFEAAREAEDDNDIATVKIYVSHTLKHALQHMKGAKETYFGQAKKMAAETHYVNTVRAYYACLTNEFPEDTTLWTTAAEFERVKGNKEELFDVLDRAIKNGPQSGDKNVELWLLNIRQRWLVGDLESSRAAVKQAFNQGYGTEAIWLAAIDLEYSAGLIDRVRHLLSMARAERNTDRIWIKSVAFERAHGKPEESLALVNEALKRFPKAAKLYMMKGQIYQGDYESPRVIEARAAFVAGTTACPTNATLWVLGAELEERHGLVTRARGLLERGRLAKPKDKSLWLASVRLERRDKNINAAKNLMARALQEVKVERSGALWTERIWQLEARTQRKPLAMEAIKKGCNDAIIRVTVARTFWAERRLEKAVSWFEKAIEQDGDDGDTWAWYLQFMREYGTEEKRNEIVRRCAETKPKHGDVWPAVRKDPHNAQMKTDEVLEAVRAILVANK